MLGLIVVFGWPVLLALTVGLDIWSVKRGRTHRYGEQHSYACSLPMWVLWGVWLVLYFYWIVFVG